VTMAWILLAMLRSGSGISAILASRSRSPSARVAPARAAALISRVRLRIAARSSAVNPSDALVVVPWAAGLVAFFTGFFSTMAIPSVPRTIPASAT